MEINHTDCNCFEFYLKQLAKHQPKEYKIVLIDNAGFHSTKHIKVPHNIYLMNIPAYCPELNPCEQVWQFIKQRLKNQYFDHMGQLRKWMDNIVNKMTKKQIISITSNHHYLDSFNATFK